MKDDAFHLPRSSYQELVKIISAYGQTEKPATLAEISALSTIGTSGVSSNNAFFLEVGIIEGGNKKVATPSGRALARALLHDMSDEIAKSWKAIVENNTFLSKMIVALKIRKQMESSALVSHIAFNSGEKNSRKVLTGARAVIDIFSAAELIREEGGLLVPIIANEEPMKTPILDSIQKQATKDLADNKPTSIAHLQTDTNPSLNLSIEIRIDANTQEFTDLGTKIREFVQTLSAPYENSSSIEDE